MSNTIMPSIELLPVEIFHRIFDNLDTETIFFSIRLVSRLFRSIVNTYDRYNFDMKLISKSHFHILCQLIKPEDIISLTLSNHERTSNQIDLFLSLVHLPLFTRLRSITLLEIDENQLNFIFKRINLKLLTSFSFSITKYDEKRKKTTNNLLSSILAYSNLRQLEFDIPNERLFKEFWSINCPIRYLTINNYITMNNLLTILQFSPYLHTIIMKKGFDEINGGIIPTFSSLPRFRQLISLTVEELNMTINRIQSFLSLTPSLIYLKLIGGQYMIDSSRWENFIELHQPQLNKFEFFFTESNRNRTTSADLELIIASFQTAFWIEHKKWYVTCECNTDKPKIIYLYSIPICKSSLEYEPKLKKFSLSTCSKTTDQYPVLLNNVKSLILTLNESVTSDIHEKRATMDRPLLPNVTDIVIDFYPDQHLFSLKFLSTIILAENLVQIKLESYFFGWFEKETFIDIGTFLQQAHNLSLLIIRNKSYKDKLPQTIENLIAIFPRRLKHLQIPISNLRQIKMILERCENLITIKCDVESQYSEEIIQYLTDSTIKSSFWNGSEIVTAWLGKRKSQQADVQIDNKRIKLCNT